MQPKVAKCFYLLGDGTRCSSPIARASPQMGSRISIHRPMPDFSFLRSNPLSFSFVHRKVYGFAEGLGVSNESTDRATRSMFQRGKGGCKTSSSLSFSLSPNTSFRGYTHQIFTFLHLFCSTARLWRGCNLHSLVFETGTCVSSFVEETATCVHMFTFVCICMYERVL